MKQVRAGLLFLFVLVVLPCVAFGGGTARVVRGSLILENVPDIPAELAARMRGRHEYQAAEFLDWTGNGEAVLVSTGPAAQIHSISSPLGAGRQLTSSSEPLKSAVAQPSGEGFVYAEDQGGDEYYQLNASMAQFRDRVRAGVSIVAISDFHSFLENTAEYRRDLRRAEYGDERDPSIAAFLKRIAPLSRAHRITAPMFIVHGANDPRVPASQAEKLLSVLKANGTEPWLMIAKDEGHGFTKKDNIIKLDEAVNLFLRQVSADRNADAY